MQILSYFVHEFGRNLNAIVVSFPVFVYPIDISFSLQDYI